jgi:predicted TIM-barrel fold metal-dependent hydrolase
MTAPIVVGYDDSYKAEEVRLKLRKLHIQSRYLDDQFFWPILECAEALDVPIYLHPTQPPKSLINASYSGFSQILTELLSGPGVGLAH